tara:strand:- start:88 stop:564 length:477 start_codon:yes stop_codon:yes gene_type:complete
MRYILLVSTPVAVVNLASSAICDFGRFRSAPYQALYFFLSYLFSFNMTIHTSSAWATEADLAGSVACGNSAGGGLEVLNRNTLTTAGVLVGGATALSATALVTAAMPVQMALAAGTSAGLIYLGDRQHRGLPVNPFEKGSDVAKPEPATEKAEAPAAA